MTWVYVALAGLVAVLVRADARGTGPYFAFYELLPGMGITEAVLRGEERPLRLAVIRRFGYAFLLGLALTFAFDAQFVDVSAAGLLVGALLLWPLTVQGMPTWVAPLRTLVMLYLGVALAFAASAALGHLFVVLVAERNLVGFLQKEALRTFGTFIAAAFALTFIGFVPRSAR